MPKFIVDKCPVCGSNKNRKIGKPDMGEIEIEKPQDTLIVRCSDCSTIYVNPMPVWDKNDFSKLYADAEEYFHQSEESLKIRELRTTERRFSEIEKYIDTENKNILEVGAGIHAYMSKYLEKKGWNITLQEPSLSFSKKLKDTFPSFQITTDDFLSLNSDKKYSLIYIDSVMEHVSNPIDYVKKCTELLEPGGILYFISPNEHSFSNYMKTKIKKEYVSYLCPYTSSFHLIGFSQKSIRILAQKSGLQLKKHIRKYDYFWHYILQKNLPVIKYPLALSFYLLDSFGWGENQEVILKKEK